MTLERNVQLMQRWFQEVWNEGNTQTVHDLLAPDAVARGHKGPQGEMRGPKEFLNFVGQIRGAFPDIRLVVEDILAAHDKVVVRWSATMTHTGPGLGIPATGKSVRSTGISIVRIVNGQIVEGWDNWDQLGMLEQIGAYSPTTEVVQKSA
jgi:steroid delta-isomerase-like uncharacterized protein